MIKLYNKNTTCFTGSGALANFGEGYWYTKILVMLGLLNYKGIIFVSKTCTNTARAGNTPFIYDEKEYLPVELKPKSIIANWFRSAVLNCVGLGNPGLEAFIKTGKWQKRTDVYVISWMAISEDKLSEARKARDLFNKYKSELGRFVIEINISCTNIGENQKELITEALQIINIISQVDLPILVKVSIAAAPLEFMMELNENIVAITCSNTIPYGWQPTEKFYGEMKINWKKLFGKKSPLEKIFGPTGKGGLSGAPIKPLVLMFIKELRNKGFTKPIIGGGGIMSASDVLEFKNSGANACFIASAFFFRFWRIKKIITTAKNKF